MQQDERDRMIQAIKDSGYDGTEVDGRMFYDVWQAVELYVVTPYQQGFCGLDGVYAVNDTYVCYTSRGGPVVRLPFDERVKVRLKSFPSDQEVGVSEWDKVDTLKGVTDSAEARAPIIAAGLNRRFSHRLRLRLWAAEKVGMLADLLLGRGRFDTTKVDLKTYRIYSSRIGTPPIEPSHIHSEFEAKDDEAAIVRFREIITKPTNAEEYMILNSVEQLERIHLVSINDKAKQAYLQTGQACRNNRS